MNNEDLRNMLESLAVGDTDTAKSSLDRWLLDKSIELNASAGVTDSEGGNDE